MGRTIESYRMALESEINRWSGFARALRKDDREAFEELMDMCRRFSSEGGNATNPIIFEPMVMSILIAWQEKIRRLEQELKEDYTCKVASNIKEATEQIESGSSMSAKWTKEKLARKRK